MVERTAKGGGSWSTCSAPPRYAPGAAAAQMVDAIVLDEKRVRPAPPTWRASTASRASTWASRSSSARKESSGSSCWTWTVGAAGAAGVRGRRPRRRLRPDHLGSGGSRPPRAHGDRLRRVSWIGSPARRRSPQRARTSPCSRAGGSRSSGRRAGWARSGTWATSRSPATSSGRWSARSSRSVRSSTCSSSTAGRPARAADVTDEQVESAVALLLLSAVRLNRRAAPHLEASGHGRVVAITSTSVKEPIDNLALRALSDRG